MMKLLGYSALRKRLRNVDDAAIYELQTNMESIAQRAAVLTKSRGDTALEE